MKFNLIVAVFVAGLCMAHAAVDSVSDVNNSTAKFSSVEHVESDLKTFTNQQLDKSYDFLLLAFTFDKYSMDRPGFEKLYRKISDKAWEDTIALVKYQSRRGLTVQLGEVKPRVLKGKLNLDTAQLLNSTELTSLTTALEYEKHLAEESHRIHKKISHAHHQEDKKEYDPDVAHYLDEEIIEYQSGTIRKLTGYIHNLHSIMNEPEVDGKKPSTKALGIHMFDEYLNSVE